MRRSLVAVVVLASAAGAQVVQDPPPPRRPGPALLSVYYTSAPQPTGVYLREAGGEVKRIWEGRPYDALAVPGRSTIVCERAQGRVTWLDPEGKPIWSKEGLEGPVDVELADGGKTVVVVQEAAGDVIGIDRESGQVKWRRDGFYNHYDVEVLPDGGLIVADSGHGRVVWLDRAGKVLREKKLPYPNTVTRLESGNTLVTTYHHRRVVEVDGKGEVVWEATIPGEGSVFRAVRRDDGRTVVIVGEVGERKVGRILVLDPRGQVEHEEEFPAGGVVDFEPLDDF